MIVISSVNDEESQEEEIVMREGGDFGIQHLEIMHLWLQPLAALKPWAYEAMTFSLAAKQVSVSLSVNFKGIMKMELWLKK